MVKGLESISEGVINIVKGVIGFSKYPLWNEFELYASMSSLCIKLNPLIIHDVPN